MLAKARERVEGWRLDGSVHLHYAEAWHRLLAGEPEEVAERLADPSETMRALRQCSPFAGGLEPRERWQILRRFRERKPGPASSSSTSSGRRHRSQTTMS